MITAECGGASVPPSWTKLPETDLPKWSNSTFKVVMHRRTRIWAIFAPESGRRFRLLPPSDCSIGGQSAAAATTTSKEPSSMIEKEREGLDEDKNTHSLCLSSVVGRSNCWPRLVQSYTSGLRNKILMTSLLIFSRG